LRFNSQRFRVLEVLAAHGPSTAARIADRLGMSRNQVATRLGECRAVGWVDYARNAAGAVITEPTSEDSDGMVQEITSAGWLAMREAPRTVKD
jgi:DNA-binding MarR family transcriptional regulator